MTSHVTVLWIIPIGWIVHKGGEAIDRVCVVFLNGLGFESLSAWHAYRYDMVLSSCDL
jgi:hypothetical protein